MENEVNQTGRKNIYDPQFVKNLFNTMSGSYERMNYITSFGFSIRWRKQFLRKLTPSTEKLNVLDLLSGLGENWSYLKKHFPQSNFHALDFSEAMLSKSKPKGERIFGKQLTLFSDDVLNNSLPSSHYDIVTCAYGLKTFNNSQLDILARELSRVLSPNGQFTFIEVSVPKSPILAFFYGLYLGHIIPVLGKLFLGNPSDYKMLWIYTKSFQNTQQIQEIFSRYNLELEIDSYFFGCATGIHGFKK